MVASGLLVVIVAGITAFFMQSFLAYWRYDSLLSLGLIIIAAGCLLLFSIVWIFLSHLGAILSGLRVSQTMSRQSVVFLPVFLLIVPLLLLYNDRPHSARQFFVVCVGMALVLGVFLLVSWRKQGDKKQSVRRLGRKAMLFFLLSFGVIFVFLRMHDRYLSVSYPREIELVRYDGFAKTMANTKELEKFIWKTRVPPGGIFQRWSALEYNNLAITMTNTKELEKFIWKTRVPPGGMFQVDVDIRNRTASAPINYNLHLKPSKGKGLVISKGQLRQSEVSRIKCDISRFEGETVTLEFKICYPLSAERILSRLHRLIELSLLGRSKLPGKLDNKMPRYWSQPIIYNPRNINEANILIIFIDTLRADHLGCYGYELNTSPSIDHLAQKSVLFENTISQSPWTLPSFVSVLTGRMPSSHRAGERGLLVSEKDGSKIAIFSSQPNFIDLLDEYGYYSVGFTSNPYLMGNFGIPQAFHEYYLCYENELEGGTNVASRWLELNSDKKFFCLLHYMAPHMPYTVREGFYSSLKESHGALLTKTGTYKDHILTE